MHFPSALAHASANRASIQEIDVPLVQHHLSRAIDEASFRALLASAPDVRSRALALSSGIRHAGDWLNGVGCLLLPLVFIFMKGNFDCACSTGWGSPCLKKDPNVQSVIWSLTPSGITRLGVGVMGIEFTGIMLSVMQYSLQLNLLP